MGRCKPLGSLNSFLPYVPQLSGADPVFLFSLRIGRSLLLAFPQLLSYPASTGLQFWKPSMAPPLQYSCLENPMDGGAWWAAVHGVTKSWIRLSNFPFTFHFHALEKEMATHSSVLAWRIPGMGEPGGLPSMVTQSRTRLK